MSYKVSPSQVKTYALCARKWAFDKIDRIPRSDTNSTRKGRAVHAHLESYYRDGTPIDVSTFEGRIAAKGPEILPPRETFTGVEHPIQFQWDNVHYHGIADLRQPGHVFDHKTSRDPERYAVRDLAEDVQALTYGMAEVLEGHELIGLSWVYYHSERLGFSPFVVHETLPAATIKQNFERIVHPIGVEITEAITKYRRAVELPANPRACGAYGGCQYAHICPKTSEETMAALLGKRNTTMGLKNLLKEKKLPPPRVNSPEMAHATTEQLKEASQVTLKASALSKKQSKAESVKIAEAVAQGEPVPEIEVVAFDHNKLTKDDLIRLVHNGVTEFTNVKGAGTTERPYVHGRTVSSLDAEQFAFEKIADGYRVTLRTDEPEQLELPVPDPQNTGAMLVNGMADLFAEMAERMRGLCENP